MATLEALADAGEVEDEIPEDVLSAEPEEILRKARNIDSECMTYERLIDQLRLEMETFQERVKENQEKIKMNKQLPYLVGNVVELLDVEPEEEEGTSGGSLDLDSQRKGKCAVIKTSTRQTIFLPVIGLVPAEDLKPADLVGVNKDSYLILDTLPAEYDARVKAMEVDDKPEEQYTDIGGLDKQIQELVEAIVLPMTA